MPTNVEVVVRPSGLHPYMQMRAHYLVREEGMSLDDASDELYNMKGTKPSRKCVWSGVKRVAEVLDKPGEKLFPETKYMNCGRRPALTDTQRLLDRWFR